jgi:hypothetical protein
MRAVAIRKGSREKAVGFEEMGTLRCDECGEEFFIGHDSPSVDKRIAEKQAKWLEIWFLETVWGHLSRYPGAIHRR